MCAGCHAVEFSEALEPRPSQIWIFCWIFVRLVGEVEALSGLSTPHGEASAAAAAAPSRASFPPSAVSAMGCMVSVPQDPALYQAIRSKTKHPVNGATHYPRFARPSSYRLSDPDGNDPTSAELDDKRREFWDTQPSYGGSAEIWAALKMAAETMLRPHGDLALCYAVIESADVIVAKPDMTVCYDTMGAKYDIPKWVLRDPSNVRFKPPRSGAQLDYEQVDALSLRPTAVDVDDDAGSGAGSSVLSAASDLEGDVAQGEIETNGRGRDVTSSAINGRREGEIRENGFEAEDIELVMTRAGVSRDKAIDALKANDGDAVSAIMDLTM